MTCRELVAFLDDYLAGALGADELAKFRAHLAVCDPCVVYIETYRSTVAMGRRAFERPLESDVPEEVPEDLVVAILAARKGER